MRKRIILILLIAFSLSIGIFSIIKNKNGALAEEEAAIADTFSASDLGIGNIEEQKSYTSLDKDMRINFSEENTDESIILKFYYQPSGITQYDSVTIRIGFEDDWTSKARFVLSDWGKALSYFHNDTSIETKEDVFTDTSKEYLIEIGVIRNGSEKTNVYVKVDDAMEIDQMVDDVGLYDDTNNRIHFYSSTTSPWKIRDYREIDENYDTITLHDIYLTANRLQREDQTMTADLVKYGNYKSTNENNNVVLKLYYSSGNYVGEEGSDSPTYIRLKTTTSDHNWLGLNVILNHFGDGLTLQREIENDDKTVRNVFGGTNEEYLIEIGAVGIKDDDSLGYIYVKVDGELIVSWTFDEETYNSNYISFCQSGNNKSIQRTFKSAETVNVYDENDSIIDSYLVPYREKISIPEYVPGTKTSDKYYESYTYQYWSIDSETEFDFENSTIRKDTDLKPFYKGENAIAYEITFKGYESEQKVSYSKDMPLVTPDVPTKEYYKGSWEDFEEAYEEGQVVNAKYQAILYKVLVKFTFDKKESQIFYFSADNTEEEMNEKLNSILALKPEDNAKYKYSFDVTPTSLELGNDYEFTISKTSASESKSGCKSVLSSSLILPLLLMIPTLWICQSKKKNEGEIYE